MKKVFDLADRLGDLSSVQSRPRPIERPKTVEQPLARLARKDVWPPEVWAEIQAIYAGEVK